MFYNHLMKKANQTFEGPFAENNICDGLFCKSFINEHEAAGSD